MNNISTAQLYESEVGRPDIENYTLLTAPKYGGGRWVRFYNPEQDVPNSIKRATSSKRKRGKRVSII